MMYEETFPEKRRKLIGIILITIALGVIIWATTDNFDRGPGRDPTANTASLDLLSPSSSTSKEPPIDRHSYLIRERKTINDHVTTKGLLLGEYKKEFTNYGRNNYDIEAYFKDFARDMEIYAHEIEIARGEVQSMRPTDAETKSHQQDMVDRLSRLENIVLQYQDHMRSPKETVEYLTRCQHEYRRVADAM